MDCPFCHAEMKKGYLISSREITFVEDGPDWGFFRVAKKTDLPLTKKSGLSIPHCQGYQCNYCKKIVIDYDTADKN